MLMDQQHPITPPPELRRLWAQQARRMDPWDSVAWLEHVSTQAARWGADQELEACSEWLLNSAPWTVDPNERPEWVQTLKRCRRPKPPSLAEAALEVVTSLRAGKCVHRNGGRMNVLTAALERLQELEKGNE